LESPWKTLRAIVGSRGNLGDVAPPVRLETARLVLRPLAEADLDALCRLQQDPEMMRYMGNGHVHDRRESEVWLRWHEDLWDVDGYSLFAVDLKPDMVFAGWIGLTKPHWFPELMPTPEIGWFVDRSMWGRGLAPEGAAATLRFAFDDVGVDRVLGIYHADNHRSGRVMEKIGMAFWREVPHPDHEHLLRIYEISRPDVGEARV
jgi:RimJ/RimL family protein N-acetyltransferase